MKKRVLAVFLALVLCLGLLPAAAFAADEGGFASVWPPVTTPGTATVNPGATAMAGGPHSSGSTTLPKLSKQEIAQLLRDNPQSTAADVFDVQPSLSNPYAPGKVKDSALQAVLNRLNALRRIAGLPPAQLDAALNESAQYGAVLLATSAFGHTPPKPADMSDAFYQKAYSATSTSNICAGNSLKLTRSVDSLMGDKGWYNADTVGHRRWQLNPTMGKVGFGYVWNRDGYVDEMAHDKSGAGCDYDFIGWPASGNFPSDLFGGDILWSVTLNPSRYQTPSQSQIKVTLTRESDGRTWIFSGSDYRETDYDIYFHVDTGGYGVSNCIIFRPDGVNFYEGVYTVKIDGLKTKSGQAVTDFEYQVDFFNAEALIIDGLHLDFADVPDWCLTPVSWAVYREITKGTGNNKFSPSDLCKNCEIITFLWRAAGEPTPSYRTFDWDAYYTDAMDWAFVRGLVGKNIDPNAYCSRSDAITYIWQAVDSFYHPYNGGFSDVSADAYYASAVAWAVENGITNGYSDNTFRPANTCSRGEIVTFLHRAYVPEVRLK